MGLILGNYLTIYLNINKLPNCDELPGPPFNQIRVGIFFKSA
jgi:hypothetical protein